jgi:hypothetical protein
MTWGKESHIEKMELLHGAEFLRTTGSPNQTALHSKGMSHCSDSDTRRPSSRIQTGTDCCVRINAFKIASDFIFAEDNQISREKPYRKTAPTN